MNETASTKRELLVFDTTEELFKSAAARIARLAHEAVEARGEFLFVLAGGETPKPLYRRLAGENYRNEIPWQQTHIFWGDERAVPPDDPQSNFGMAAEHLLQDLPLPTSNIHRIKGEMGAAAAARDYARELQSLSAQSLAWPRFDLVLLGLGSDGHTASLFPGSTHPSRSAQATLAVTGSYDQRATSRVTLTPPVFNSSRHIFFLVTGEKKASILANVLDEEQSAVRYPSRRIKPARGIVTWYIDRAAAAKLPSQLTS